MAFFPKYWEKAFTRTAPIVLVVVFSLLHWYYAGPFESILERLAPNHHTRFRYSVATSSNPIGFPALSFIESFSSSSLMVLRSVFSKLITVFHGLVVISALLFSFTLGNSSKNSFSFKHASFFSVCILQHSTFKIFRLTSTFLTLFTLLQNFRFSFCRSFNQPSLCSAGTVDETFSFQ